MNSIFFYDPCPSIRPLVFPMTWKSSISSENKGLIKDHGSNTEGLTEGLKILSKTINPLIKAFRSYRTTLCIMEDISVL